MDYSAVGSLLTGCEQCTVMSHPSVSKSLNKHHFSCVLINAKTEPRLILKVPTHFDLVGCQTSSRSIISICNTSANDYFCKYQPTHCERVHPRSLLMDSEQGERYITSDGLIELTRLNWFSRNSQCDEDPKQIKQSQEDVGRHQSTEACGVIPLGTPYVFLPITAQRWAAQQECVLERLMLMLVFIFTFLFMFTQNSTQQVDGLSVNPLEINSAL